MLINRSLLSATGNYQWKIIEEKYNDYIHYILYAEYTYSSSMINNTVNERVCSITYTLKEDTRQIKKLFSYKEMKKIYKVLEQVKRIEIMFAEDRKTHATILNTLFKGI